MEGLLRGLPCQQRLISTLGAVGMTSKKVAIFSSHSLKLYRPLAKAVNGLLPRYCGASPFAGLRSPQDNGPVKKSQVPIPVVYIIGQATTVQAYPLPDWTWS